MGTSTCKDIQNFSYRSVGSTVPILCFLLVDASVNFKSSICPLTDSFIYPLYELGHPREAHRSIHLSIHPPISIASFVHPFIPFNNDASIIFRLFTHPFIHLSICTVHVPPVQALPSVCLLWSILLPTDLTATHLSYHPSNHSCILFLSSRIGSVLQLLNSVM